METENAFNEIVDWVESKKGKFNPAQVASILISQGASLAFYYAPNQEEARVLIEESVQCALKDHLKAGE